jgi:hypothetical protein
MEGKPSRKQFIVYSYDIDKVDWRIREMIVRDEEIYFSDYQNLTRQKVATLSQINQA